MYGPSVFPYQPEGVWDIPYSDDKWVQSGGEDQLPAQRLHFYSAKRALSESGTYDAPSREFCTVRRVRTNTPLQALDRIERSVFLSSGACAGEEIVAEGGAKWLIRLIMAIELHVARPPSASELTKVTGVLQPAVGRL